MPLGGHLVSLARIFLNTIFSGSVIDSPERLTGKKPEPDFAISQHILLQYIRKKYETLADHPNYPPNILSHGSCTVWYFSLDNRETPH